MGRAEPKNNKIEWEQNGIMCLNLSSMNIRELENRDETLQEIWVMPIYWFLL